MQHIYYALGQLKKRKVAKIRLNKLTITEMELSCATVVGLVSSSTVQTWIFLYACFNGRANKPVIAT